MAGIRKLNQMTLLAFVLAGSVCVLGAISCAFSAQSTEPGAQNNGSAPTLQDVPGDLSKNPSAGAASSGPMAPPNLTRRRLTLDERVKVFAKNLNLTGEQASEVKKILEQQQQEILNIRRDPELVGRAGIDRVRALQVITVERIRAILDEEQKKKYDPLAPRRLPQTPPEHSVEDWLNAIT